MDTNLDAKTAVAAKQLDILLIDDSATIRQYLRQTLKEAFPHSTIEECSEGKQGIMALARRKRDVIITDLQMPGIDGRKFLELIIKNPLLKNKPVLVMSSQITKDLVDAYTAYSNIVFLPKPARKEVILDFVEQLLAA